MDGQRYHQFIIQCPRANPEELVECTFTVPIRYTNLQFLGEGKQGIVVTADDERQPIDSPLRVVAIKKLRQAFFNIQMAQQSYREFVLLKTFKHRNIIQLLNAFTPNDSVQNFEELYLVMEYAQTSLPAIVYQAKHAPLHHKVISSVIYQLLSALKHLHESGIRHRDLKTANITTNNLGVVKVLDFGNAKHFHSAMQTLYVGRRDYRAPESIVSGFYDDKLDVWSVGCIMAELITGSILFESDPTYRIDDPLQTVAWMAIVEKLGTPNDDFFASLDPYVAQFYRGLQYFPATPMERLFPDYLFRDDQEQSYFTAACARDLLSKLLKINPRERVSVCEALHHPYLQFHFREEHVNIPPLTHSYILEVDNVQADRLEELKAHLFREVKEFEEAHDIYEEIRYAIL